MLLGRGLCDELITRPEESYRLWCVVVCDLGNLKNEEAMIRVGSQRHRKKKSILMLYSHLCLIHPNDFFMSDFLSTISFACLPLPDIVYKIKVKSTLILALRLCTGRTAHRGSRGIGLLFHDHGIRRG